MNGHTSVLFFPAVQFAVLVAATGVPLAAQSGPPSKPNIQSAIIATNASQITITGNNFGTSTPTVTLDALPLQILNYTPTIVVASLPPNLLPGSYELALINMQTQQQGIFSATIGAVGPPGTPGPAGLQGTPGPQGPMGAQGLRVLPEPQVRRGRKVWRVRLVQRERKDRSDLPVQEEAGFMGYRNSLKAVHSPPRQE